MSKLVQWIRGGLSYSDGTMDTEVMLAVWSVLVFTGTTVLSVWKGQHWDAQAFGIGAGALFGGLSAVLKFRKVD